MTHPSHNALAPKECERRKGAYQAQCGSSPSSATLSGLPLLAACLLWGVGLGARAQTTGHPAEQPADRPIDCARAPAPDAAVADAQAYFASLEPHCLRSAAYYRQHGQWLLKQGSHGAALEALERALLLEPEHLGTQLDYAQALIMVGDADQLPSVGPGNILGEVVRSGLVPTVCLNEIFRQARRSLIVENAHHIISGEPLKKGGKTDDFFFLEADGDAAQKLVCDLVTTRLPRSYGFDPVRDIQVLCPTKLGPTGTQALNVELQNLLNPEQKGKPQLQSASRVFRVGDKVMQVRNNYEIVWNRIGGEQGVGAYNGDIGIVESINTRDRSMVVRMDDKRLVYPAENLNELEIAYAITVHKSQGSEFPAVILPVAQVPPRLCYRNLFYTGVTRAR